MEVRSDGYYERLLEKEVENARAAAKAEGIIEGKAELKAELKAMLDVYCADLTEKGNYEEVQFLQNMYNRLGGDDGEAVPNV